MVAVEIILTFVLFLVSVGLVVAISMQESSQQGAGSIYGGSEGALGKNQSKSKEQRLVFWTRIGGIALVVLSVGMVLLQKLA